jgi:hypothetical protein
MVIMTGAIVLTIGMAGLMMGVVLNRSVSSLRLSERALAGARAGISDANRRIVRNTEWSPSCASVTAGPVSYSLSLGSASVAVCAAKTVTGFTVGAIGSSGGFRRRIDAEFGVNQQTGQVRLVSSDEIPL